MKIYLKQGVRLLFINDILCEVLRVLFEAFSERNIRVVMTSGSDGQHGLNSYHTIGYAWDFRTSEIPREQLPVVTYQIAMNLKRISQYFDVVLEHDPEHLHVEFDLRRQSREGTDIPSSTVLDNSNQEGKEQKKMAVSWKWLLSLVALALRPLMSAITEKFRDEIAEWIQKMYDKAKETDNPMDDLFFEWLAKMLSIDLN